MTYGMPRFGDALRRLIRERHLSQREFAAAAGISTETVTRALKMNEPEMNQTTYRAIAGALGLSPEDLDREWKTTLDLQGVPVSTALADWIEEQARQRDTKPLMIVAGLMKVIDEMPPQERERRLEKALLTSSLQSEAGNRYVLFVNMHKHFSTFIEGDYTRENDAIRGERTGVTAVVPVETLRSGIAASSAGSSATPDDRPEETDPDTGRPRRRR